MSYANKSAVGSSGLYSQVWFQYIAEIQKGVIQPYAKQFLFVPTNMLEICYKHFNESEHVGQNSFTNYFYKN